MTDTKKILDYILPAVQQVAGDRKVTIGTADLSFRKLVHDGITTIQVLVCGRYVDRKIEVCAVTKNGMEKYRAKLDVPEDFQKFDLEVLVNCLKSSLLR